MIYQAKGFADTLRSGNRGAYHGQGQYGSDTVAQSAVAHHPIVALKNFVAGVGFLLGLLSDRRD